MDREAIATTFKKIVADKLEVDIAKITDTSNFVNDLEADSIAILEMVMETEEQFHIVIPDGELKYLSTVKDVIDLICKNKS